MTKKKNKFDLGSLIHDGALKDGQTLVFVSDPSKKCRIEKQPNGEYKVKTVAKEPKTCTIHQFSVECLGMEPPDHASKWFRTEDSEGKKILYDLWHAGEDDYAQAA